MAIPGYKILKKIGDGGMSSVYLAIQLSVGREVALKVLSPELRNEKNFIEKFFREANIVGTLSHPNIVSIYDVGTHDGHYYIAMDYLPGDACSDRIKASEIDLHTGLRIIRDIASALDYAHERGFVHCDVKPDNILFRHDGSAVLTDFGIAIAANVASRGSIAGVAGTPHYMSPEQTQGSGIDGRADLYSLGVVFYEMLVHEVPFKGKDAVAVAMKHMTAPIPQLPEHLKEFQPIINRLLAKKPASRYQSGRELIAAIDVIAEVQESPRGRSRSASGGGDLLQSTFAAPASALSAVGRFANSKLDVLRRLQFSPRYGLVLQGAGSHLLDTHGADMGADSEGDTTSFNTTSFRRNLGEALQQNLARRLVAPIWIALLLLALLVSILATQFGQLFGSAFWRQLSGPEIVSVVEPAPQIATPKPPAAAAPATAPPVAAPPVAATATENSAAEMPAADMNTAAALPVDGAADAGSTIPTDPAQAPLDANTAPMMAADGSTMPQDGAPVVAGDLPAEAAVPVEPPKTYKFSLNVNPADAGIRIVNIKPKYSPEMQLPAGKYHVMISKPGYIPQDRWLVVRNKDLVTDITLEKIIVRPRYTAGQVIQDSLGDAGIGPAMIVLPRGSFTMGNDEITNAAPARTIRIEKLIAFARHEVTYDDYALYATATGKPMPEPAGKHTGDHPVAMVTWQQASDYARWLTENTGQRYRLPTEAEWEYAARAGTTGNYWWKGKEAKKKANCSLGCDSEYIRFLSSSSAPVGHYAPNAWGIYDTAGNVAEWVQDCYHPSYVGAPPVATAWIAGSCNKRPVRGGSFKNKAAEITNASREGVDASTQKKFIGFRVVREIVE
jgi:serine/threonine-protein kinase PpkA